MEKQKEVLQMQILADRLKALREGMKMSQGKIAKLVGTTQTSIGRYENQIGLPPHKTLLWYADYFDVSMDYIYGRTDKPQGKLYEFRPKNMVDSEEMRQFIEMCFDPNSPMNDRLKQTLIEMLGDASR
jgi:transcriptional regulator with XRE-family HTH domain